MAERAVLLLIRCRYKRASQAFAFTQCSFRVTNTSLHLIRAAAQLGVCDECAGWPLQAVLHAAPHLLPVLVPRGLHRRWDEAAACVS